MTLTIVEDTRCHRRCGHPCGHPRRRGPGSDRRHARRQGVPGDRGRLRRSAGLAGRVRHRALVGVEGTGSYGAGLARHLAAAGVRVVEVDRSDRQDRRRQGKSDPLDAVSAARAALSGRALGVPKGRDGAVEAIRALMVAKRSARGERTQTINQARALIVTGPDELRARFAGILRLRWSPSCRRVAAPGRGRPRLRHPDRTARVGPPRGVPRCPAAAPRRTDRPARHHPRTRACSPSTASGRTPPPCCWSLPGTTPRGCAARPPGRTCARSPRSPHRRGRPPATGSTPAVTARPTTPCGGS